MIKDFGLGKAVEISLFLLGLKKNAKFGSQHIFNYPNTSFKIKIDQGPLAFWKRLEQENWEIELIRFINNLVKPGETILDIGAWIGPLTFLFSHLTGKNGGVYAFEPNPESFSLLQHYTTDNQLENIELHNTAINNMVGSIKLHSPSRIGTMATIRPWPTGAPEYKYEWNCDCTTIDEFCTSRNIKPDGIKIDVEGAEENVLNGATKIIEKYKPWIILEFHGNFLSENDRQRLWSFITCRAKKIILIEGNEENIINKRELPPDFQPKERSNYCIFFK